MTALGERTLIQHLTDPDSLDVLAREGMDPLVLPTADFRKVYEFALRYYHASGRNKAPSTAVLRTEFGDLLDDNELVLEDPEDSVEWAIDNLKASFVYKASSQFNKQLATAVADAEPSERLDVFTAHVNEAVALSLALQSHHASSDAREDLALRLVEYEARQATRGQIRGMRFGLPQIDEYTGGIRDGELAIVAAPPKTGKSYFAAYVALQEWKAGKPVALFSLENLIEMTLDRIACLACGVDGRQWEHGDLPADKVEQVRQWITDMQQHPVPLWILKPDPGKRNIEQLVKEAQVRGARSLIIDQLTFVELPDPRKAKHERIGDMLHRLHTMISTGRDRMPCMMIHQINREGVKAAKKLGHLEMEHMAEASEVERTADWVFGLFQTGDDVHAAEAKFQTLGARREANKHFQMAWHISKGSIAVSREMALTA